MSANKFIHDRIVLLLVSINSFLTVVASMFILLSMNSAKSASYIVEYRGNLGLSAYKPGDSSAFLSFIVFMFLVLGFHILLARKVFHIRRQLSLVIMGMGTLLIVLSAIVSSALLGIS